MKEILQFLKTNGEQMDTEIASAVGVSLTKTRTIIAEMTERGEIMSCYFIKYENGKKIEGWSCRISGYIPPATPGRKSQKVQLKLS